MLYKQNFLYQLLVFQFFFSTTSRYQPMSMFNVKNEIWDSTETKDTPYLIFTSRSDTVPHPAMVNMTHNTKNNRSHLILILFPPQNSMSQYNNVYTKKENETCLIAATTVPPAARAAGSAGRPRIFGSPATSCPTSNTSSPS